MCFIINYNYFKLTERLVYNNDIWVLCTFKKYTDCKLIIV